MAGFILSGTISRAYGSKPVMIGEQDGIIYFLKIVLRM